MNLWKLQRGLIFRNNLAARGYQTFDTLLLTAIQQKRNKFF